MPERSIYDVPEFRAVENTPKPVEVNRPPSENIVYVDLDERPVSTLGFLIQMTKHTVSTMSEDETLFVYITLADMSSLPHAVLQHYMNYLVDLQRTVCIVFRGHVKSFLQMSSGVVKDIMNNYPRIYFAFSRLDINCDLPGDAEYCRSTINNSTYAANVQII